MKKESSLSYVDRNLRKKERKKRKDTNSNVLQLRSQYEKRRQNLETIVPRGEKKKKEEVRGLHQFLQDIREGELTSDYEKEKVFPLHQLLSYPEQPGGDEERKKKGREGTSTPFILFDGRKRCLKGRKREKRSDALCR